jgi:signal transduction histidine kinase
MRALSLRTKVFLLFAGAALLTVIPVLVLISGSVEARVTARAQEELLGARASVEYNWQESVIRLQETARRLASLREVERLIREGDTQRLAAALARQVDEGQTALAADTAGQALVGPPIDPAILNSGESRLMVPADSAVPLRVAVWPVFVERPADGLALPDAPADSLRIGMVGVGERFGPRAVNALKLAAGNTEVALVTGDSMRVVASTLPDSLIEFLGRSYSLSGLLEQRAIRLRRDERLMFLVHPLPSAGLPAAVILFRPVDEELRLARAIEQSVVGIGVIALVVALVLALLVARIVARPAQTLAAAASDLARGNFSAPLPRASGDEIGQLTRAFSDMRSAIAERESRLRSAQAELIHREKLAAMGRLVAQLSHEINNPIYNIQNCLEVLDRRSKPDDPNREFLTLARDELQRMAVLTRQMLDQSRPLTDATGPLDLNQLVRRVVTLAGAELGNQGIRVELDLEPELPRVTAHPDALQQVLANLVANGIDAMPDGGTLTLTTRSEADSVEVFVEDTGVGIASEHLPHIFDAFYTTKPGVSGIGLGLFVSEGIIRGHRGQLLVQSRAGHGSRFIVRLPLEALDAALARDGAGQPGEPAALP